MIKSNIQKNKFKRKIKENKQKLFINNLRKNSFKKRHKRSFFKFISFLDLKLDKKTLNYYYIIIILLLLLSFGVLLFGPFLKIKTINIFKTDNLTNINIAYRATDSIRGKHILFIDNKSIKNRIRNYQENIKDITISKNLLNSIDITIGSYSAVFKTKLNNKNYIITENGVFIPSRDTKELKNINIINNNIISIPDYKKLLEEKYIKKINTLYSKLKNNLITIKIKDINYYVIERELIITISNNNELIFDLNSDINPQIEKLVIFNKEHLDINKKRLVYIDLRIKNKVFFCLLTEEYQCFQNLKKMYSIKNILR